MLAQEGTKSLQPSTAFFNVGKPFKAKHIVSEINPLTLQSCALADTTVLYSCSTRSLVNENCQRHIWVILTSIQLHWRENDKKCKSWAPENETCVSNRPTVRTCLRTRSNQLSTSRRNRGRPTTLFVRHKRSVEFTAVLRRHVFWRIMEYIERTQHRTSTRLRLT